jgi:hypothetical protein
MVTKKLAAKATTKASILRFNPDWVVDPPNIFRALTPAAQRQLTKAKKDFEKRVNEILAKGQK